MSENKKGILEDLFLREKPAKILLGLKTSKEHVYATKLSKYADCTYSHTIKILNALKKMGIVTFEKSGRIKKVMLTDDGWDIAHNLEAIIKKFDQIEEKFKKAAKPKEEGKDRKKKK